MPANAEKGALAVHFAGRRIGNGFGGLVVTAVHVATADGGAAIATNAKQFAPIRFAGCRVVQTGTGFGICRSSTVAPYTATATTSVLISLAEVGMELGGVSIAPARPIENVSDSRTSAVFDVALTNNWGDRLTSGIAAVHHVVFHGGTTVTSNAQFGTFFVRLTHSHVFLATIHESPDLGRAAFTSDTQLGACWRSFTGSSRCVATFSDES